jgi:RNA recognition motif-containing protein
VTLSLFFFSVPSLSLTNDHTQSITDAEGSTTISPSKIQSPSTPSPHPALVSTMSVGYRIWVGAMGRDVTAETLTANFSRFGTLSEGIRLKTDLTHRFGSEAVIT